MAEEAEQAGVEIAFPVTVTKIDDNSVSFYEGTKPFQVSFDYLVGADGSFSKVRSQLGVSSEKWGVGINYMLPCTVEKMEWHFDASSFGSGYSWIFPHGDYTSLGVYSSVDSLNASELKDSLLKWAGRKGIKTLGTKPEAEKISFDYQGWNFGNTFLIGDAAGLASPLTGEGIFPAFVSAEAAARTILDKSHKPDDLNKLIKKHHKHEMMVKIAGKRNCYGLVLSELSLLLLRNNLISFEKFEMA